ncbi:fimbrillin family protein [Bacteroides ovatus]|nr:fimbrillin family protein [Bacteroides ovatus]
MKLFHSLLYPLLGGLFCLSCSDDEQDSGTKQPTTAGEVTFGVDLTGFSTRVTQDGSSWNDGDKIGTYVLDMKTLEPVTEAANVPYVCSEEGASVSFTSTTPLKVQNDGTPVKFVAYYPYNADVRNFNYPVQLVLLKKEEVRRATYYMLPRKKNTPTLRRTNPISH